MQNPTYEDYERWYEPDAAYEDKVHICPKCGRIMKCVLSNWGDYYTCTKCEYETN